MPCQEPSRIHLRLVFMGTASESERGKGRIYLDICYYQSHGKSRSKG
jgi:hypothetical protein